MNGDNLPEDLIIPSTQGDAFFLLEDVLHAGEKDALHAAEEEKMRCMPPKKKRARRITI